MAAIDVLQRIKAAKVAPGKGEKCPPGMYQIKITEFHLHGGFNGEVVVIGFEVQDGPLKGRVFSHAPAVGKRPDTAWRDVQACVCAAHGVQMYEATDALAHERWAGITAGLLESKGVGIIGRTVSLTTKAEAGNAPDGSHAWTRHTFTPVGSGTAIAGVPGSVAVAAPPVVASAPPPVPAAPPPIPPPAPAVVHPTYAGWHVSARRGFPWYEADGVPGALWNCQTNAQERE